MKTKLSIFLILFITSFNHISAADSDSITRKLKYYLTQAQTFVDRLPREKVFIHLDNNSYYGGDKIWFQCYVVNGFDNTPTSQSKTLYIELLNPRGKVISKQILKVDNGRCHGAFFS